MKERALRVAGIVFLVLGLVQLSRVLLMVPVLAAVHEGTIALSVVASAVMLGLAVWMFRAAR